MRDDYYSSEYSRREERIRQADAELRSMGFVRNEWGHYEDPENVTRTGAYIDYNGRICRDM